MFLATVLDALSEDDRIRRGVGRLATYLQAYPDVLVSANGWDRTTWDRIRQSDLFTDAATAGPSMPARRSRRCSGSPS